MLRILATAALLIGTVTTSAVGQGDAAEKASDARDKQICKRFTETGSLVRGYRVCKTKAEWERERDNLRQQSTVSSCRNMGQTGSC